jgi:hypothetical protein
LKSEALPGDFSATRRNPWPEKLLAQAGPRSPNPVRGPPSFLSL